MTASYLALKKAEACTVQTSQAVTTQNKAKNVIFILLAGAPSHTDTFDLKVVNGTTPAAFNPTLVNGSNWPMGLLPQIGKQLNNIAIVRSMQAWALVHSSGPALDADRAKPRGCAGKYLAEHRQRGCTRNRGAAPAEPDLSGFPGAQLPGCRG